MEDQLTLSPVAYYEGPLTEKFGLPRQSGLVPEIEGTLVFTPPYRMREAFRGMEGFSHLWLIWGFSKNHTWSPTVRPPRLGGNERLGVFATRAPFRPNPLGLSLVELVEIKDGGVKGILLVVRGADLMSGTPIYDIKPYIPYADARPQARSGFATGPDAELCVKCDEALLAPFTPTQRQALKKVLAQDPRPHYQHDAQRIYGMSFAGFDVHFRIDERTVLVTDIRKGSSD